MLVGTGEYCVNEIIISRYHSNNGGGGIYRGGIAMLSHDLIVCDVIWTAHPLHKHAHAELTQ